MLTREHFKNLTIYMEGQNNAQTLLYVHNDVMLALETLMQRRLFC